MAHIEDRWWQDTADGRVATPRNGQGRRWLVRWRDPDGRHRGKSFARHADAAAHVRSIEQGIADGSYIPRERGDILLGDWATACLSRKADLKPKTRYDYASTYRVHIAPRWETVPLNRITWEGISDWVTDMTTAGCGASTVRLAYFLLRGFLNDAEKAQRIHSNPARQVGLPRKPERRHRYLTHEQVAVLAAHMPTASHAALVNLLAYGGLRWGEAIALTVNDIDHQRERVHIDKAYSAVGGKLVLGAPKTYAIREVPLPTFVVDMLWEQCGRGLLFTARNGAPLRQNNYRRGVWLPAVQHANLPHITPHDLRHTCASLAVSAGANVLAVSRMLGHKRPSETLDTYADLFDSDLDAVAAALHAAAHPPRTHLQIVNEP